MANFI